MPNKVAASTRLASGYGMIDDLVAQGVVEDIACRLDVYPLLPIGRSYLVEFRSVEPN